MTRVLTLGACLILAAPLPGQSDPDLAKALRERYEDSQIAALSSKSIYTFSIDKSGVVIEEERSDQLISLEDAHTEHFAKFYDENSEISAIQETHAGKRKNVSSTDDYFHHDMYFHSDVRVVQYQLDFSRAGDKRLLETKQIFHDPKYFTRVFFHDYYPIQDREIDFLVPDGLKVEFRDFLFDGYEVDQKVSHDAKSGLTRYSYHLKDLEGFSTEENIDGRSRIYPHFIVLTKEYADDRQELRYFTSTDDVYHWYKSLVDEVVEDNAALQNVVDVLTKDLEKEAQIKRIFYWVQDNIRYIAFEDGITGYRPDSGSAVYQKRYGDCKGMANLTKQMLRLAGFDARLGWIGTRQLGYDYSLPSLAVDNHMICVVLMGEEFLFLDATEKFGAYQEYAERIQGKEVMIEDGETYLIRTVPERVPADNTESIRRVLQIRDKALSGKVTEVYNGESRSDILYQVNYIARQDVQDALKSFITEGKKAFSADSVQTSDLSVRDQPLHIEYQWTARNAVNAFGNELYVDLNQQKYFAGTEFEEDRTLDFLFPFKSHIEDEITLIIPEGYEVVDMPPSVSVTNPDFTISVDVEKKAHQLIYRSSIAFPQARIRKSQFEHWNNAVKTLKDCYTHQVVLAKPE